MQPISKRTGLAAMRVALAVLLGSRSTAARTPVPNNNCQAYSGGKTLASPSVYLSCFGWDCTQSGNDPEQTVRTTFGYPDTLPVLFAALGGSKYVNMATQ